MIRKRSFCGQFWCCLLFYISVGLVNPGSCARGSIVACELRCVWVIPPLYILQPIFQDKFRQGERGMTSTLFLYFISLISVHFIQSKIEISYYYFVLISLGFASIVSLESFKEASPSQLLSVIMPRRSMDTENPVIRRTYFKGYKSLFWICVIIRDMIKTQMKQD